MEDWREGENEVNPLCLFLDTLPEFLAKLDGLQSFFSFNQ